MNDIENLIDNYALAYLMYETSQTCSSETYAKQRDAMYVAKAALLAAIEGLAKNE